MLKCLTVLVSRASILQQAPATERVATFKTAITCIIGPTVSDGKLNHLDELMIMSTSE